ncbi:hypothetical protein MLD38_006855 [Melastoma candidum]|uniref:Uncharacterized protein n=1 Tax=Melastoma candidum TaxID=119954 RepID=A0ACB9RXP8_9MYRT|nr:hypothetical protein MLD38_006855 [Melastoma candidum]
MPSKTPTTAPAASNETPLIARPITAAVILVPVPFPLRSIRRRDLLLTLPLLLLVLLLLSLSIYLLYPSSPTLTLTRLRLNRIAVLTSPSLSLSFSLTLRVLNPDFFSLWMSSLHVSISYRGNDLGFLDSQPHSAVRPRGFSYINATLDLDGAKVIGDVIYLIEDVAKGVIPFNTTTNVHGELGVLFFKVPIKGKVSCDVLVNIKNQVITDQNCYPQGLHEESKAVDVS